MPSALLKNLLAALPPRHAWERKGASPKRLLFVGEAVSLSHVGRPLMLARWAREAGYEVYFACGEAYADMARAEGFDPYIVTTIVPALFYERLNKGKFFYRTDELEAYVQAESELFSRLNPDLVIGDFRVTLDISTTLAGIPFLSLNNAHWSPAAACRFPAPRHGLLAVLPTGLRNRLFEYLRPLAFRHFGVPLNRVRLRFGLPVMKDFRELYSAGTWCAYLDLPELADLAAPLPTGHFFLGPVSWAPQITNFTTETQRHGEGIVVSKNPPFSVPLCPLGLSSGRRLRGEPGSSRPLAYVSLGSTGMQEQLPPVLNALIAHGSDVVLSGLNEIQQRELRKEVPGWDERVSAARLMDPDAVLQRAWVCVCHGGSGTVYQSLKHGVPLLCLPGNPDQALIAQAIAAKGAGMALMEGSESSGSLKKALQSLSRNPSFRQRARDLAMAYARQDTQENWLAFLERALGKKNTPRLKLSLNAGQLLEPH